MTEIAVETKPKITFSDFLETTGADDRRFQDMVISKVPMESRVPPLPQTHIFNMGDDEDIMESIIPIRPDISADCRDRIPMPFGDMACVSTVPFGGQRYWILDRIISEPKFRPENSGYGDLVKDRGWTIKQHLFIMRYTEHNKELFGPAAIPTMWDVWFCGTTGDRYNVLCGIDLIFHKYASALLGDRVQVFYDLAMKETASILEQLTAISHPQNYIVRVTPNLTPREHRQVGAGEPRPMRKAPHFIVVDHDILVRMSGDHYGTHASPVPHERRGHWRRLAERCRHAKLSGKEKVFVRPTYVGERNFEDPKNKYEVLMDFGAKEAS